MTTNLILAAVLLLLALAGVVMRKTYFYLPVRELKRKAAAGDKLAIQLYRAAAYRNSLKSLLWLYIGLTSAASIILLAISLPFWVSLLIVGPALWIVFSLIPATRLTRIGTRLTTFFTPPVAWILNYLHPILSRGADIVETRYTRSDHTRMYERSDLIDMIERQQQQTDNRLSEEELEIAKRALSFDEHRVHDLLIPRKKIKELIAEDNIGPILIDEMHKTGQAYALVRETKKGPFVGSLAYSKLTITSSGKVSDLMSNAVYYLHENDLMSDALHAFFVTNHAMFVVVNSFEEYVGIITIENVLKELLGHMPGDDFDQYSDIVAVAARHAKQPKVIEPDEISDKTPEEVIE